MVRRLNEDNHDLIKYGKKDKKTLDAYKAEIKNLKNELSDCDDTKRKTFLKSTIAQYEKKAKEIEKFLKNTESLRHTRRTSVRMKESPVYGEEVVTVESPILQNLYTELQPLNRHKLCKVEMTEYVESIPGWGRKKTITTIYPEILIRLRTDSPVTIDFTNSITIREEDGSPVANYTTDSHHSSEVYSIDDVEDIIRKIFDYDQSWARESVKRTKTRSMKESGAFNPQDYKESYSDINDDNVWEVFDYVKELLTPDGLVENMARWMGLDDLTKCMQYICRTQGISVLEDEEYDDEDEFE